MSLSKSEKEELELQRFVNHYKWKTEDEIFRSLLEIKHSKISKFEYRLKESLYYDLNSSPLGLLVEYKIIMSRLIDSNSKCSSLFKERLQLIENILEKK